ncbi:hypothetical protein GIB67_025960, partial [Kingdonia uniflora]
ESNDSFIPPRILNAKNLRTFFVYPYPNPRPNLDIKLLHHLTCLRTVNLARVAIETLPNEVGSLIHLRYLDLSKTKLVELPESVCNLRNLQTLKLTSCKNLRRLPEGLRKLVNLRHLELLYTAALECLPKGIEELRCLQTLSMFVMSEEGCQLRELSNLNNLCGSLTITNIRGGGSKESKNLKSKEHIRKLQLDFVKEDYEGKKDDDGSAIELFEPHPNLEVLVVWYYGGSKFPNLMEFQSSSIMLCRLQITECRNLEILPPWANLESLQCLLLTGLDSMSPMGLFNGLEASSTTVAYPNLKELAIEDMKHWEEWVMETSSEDINVMPLLRDLYIYDCPILKSVPHQILSQSLRKLFIKDCPKLAISCLPPLLEELISDGDADIKLLHHLTCLRTVDLSYVAIETLPNEVGSLIHLRYLDLSKTKLVELPESVCNLRNLQTLKLTSCKNLRRLPEGLRKLVNLRHLELNYTDALECLPKGIEELRCLQTLSKFVMSEEGCQLRELSNLNNLRGSLAIAKIRGGGSKESINLKSKEHICTLALEFVKEDYEGKRDDDGSAIELFEPHPNLEELVVWYYGGSKFPNWMEFQSSSIMLRRLQISECRNLEILPPLESLQYLYLEGLDSMSPMGLFNGLEASSTTVAYPNLKKLIIMDMKHWEEWVMEISSKNITVMPRLRDLHIYDCPILKLVPHQILSQSVRKLFIKDCPELAISCLPPLLEELILDGDAGSLSRSVPFNDNTSLKVMYIQNSPHSTLPQGLSQLKALQTLKIVDCNSLTCISEELQHLTSLRELYITRCPILGPRCEKDVGKDWSIMSRIPSIYIS